ncbi:MAG: hypothetical protein JW818_10000 [Pirellulales bacterium]|nr:hypothetical protein [Pirellulales bacterium]
MTQYCCPRFQAAVLVGLVLAVATLARVDEAAAEPFEQKLRAPAGAMAPATPSEVRARIMELRGHLAPFLRSLPPKADLRSRRMLNGDDWMMRFEIKRVSDKRSRTMAPRPIAPRWEEAGIDLSAWERTTVPEWRYDSLARKQPASCILWYRKTFKASRAPEGKRVFLCFEGVDWEAEVWLNGKKLGSHSVYFEPFRFDVTDLIAEQNTLAVRVIDGPRFGEPAAFWAPFPVPPASDQHYVPDRARSLAGLKNGDTHCGSGYGIHRDVYLETTGPAIVTELLARGYPARGEAVVHVETDVAGNPPATVKVEILPENFEGAAYRHTTAFVSGVGNGRQTVTVPMPDARRWSPELPYLYRCRVSLLDSQGRTMDVRDVVFGNRTVELVSELHPRQGCQPGTLLLNGQPLFVRGTNIQGLNALWFWGERDKLLDIMLLLKAANFNAVRACQHVTFPEVRELQDRLGILSEQDVGGWYPVRGEQVRPGLLAASAAITRHCYNNPGVILLSFCNETRFDPTDMLRAALAADPERIFLPLSGNMPKVATFQARKGREGYQLSDDLWASVIDDFHTYRGWYFKGGWTDIPCPPLPPDRLSTIGEYGGEALDSHETMQRYPKEYGPLPAKEVDTLFGHVQALKHDIRQIVGFRGRKPSNLGQYIEASQNYQYDLLGERTRTWRLSPRRIAGYFQFHFVDVLPANWPKSIVSHDLTPKRGYFAMAQVNQPLVPLPRFVKQGQAMELWVANDLAEAHPDCRIRWTVAHHGKTLVQGTQRVEVPAFGAVRAGTAALEGVPKDAEVVDISLRLEDNDGALLSQYRHEIYLAAWRQPKASPKKSSDAKPVSSKPAASRNTDVGFSVYHSFNEMDRALDPVLPPVRAVTHGPKIHWFGYYDKYQLDPSGRYLLCMEGHFEHRLPKPDEAVKIGMVDLADSDRWIELGKSLAWSWQQGCMLQWRPGSDREVVWNDRDGDHFVCRILDVKTRKLRTLPMAIEAISPDGKLAACADFSRIFRIRAGYGYAGIPDKYASELAPSEIGVWRMDLETGDTKKLVSLADLAKIPYEGSNPKHKHYVNHLAWSPDGKRLLMFHRWVGTGGQPTRVFTISPEGGPVRLLSARAASHWTWRDPNHVLIWASGAYRLYKDDGSGEPKATLWKAPNGHQTYIPGTNNEWIVTDTYPRGAKRECCVYLVHPASGRFVPLGRFASPKEYGGEWRCDTHPRVSRDGKQVIIDSPHGGNGRQQYWIDISRILSTTEP